MDSALLDSSVYISAFRSPDTALAVERLVSDVKLWLSAVVLQELYAGALQRDRYLVETLERRFSSEFRIVVPELDDWVQAGLVLARVATKHGYEKIGRSRLTNDALIAMSAARTGIRVITCNARDFEKLAEFRPFRCQCVIL